MAKTWGLHERTHLGLMLGLTFSTGVVDAVGYLGLDRVFTGNMTGNVVILGMALLGADDLPIIGPVIALVCFMAGAAIGGRVLRRVDEGWTRLSTIMFTSVGIVLLAAAVVLFAAGGHPVQGVQWTVTGMLGLGMGAQAATARHIAVKDVTTVVVTSTLAGLAADSVFGAGKGQPWARRAGAVVLIGLGAVVGAAAVHADAAIGLLVSAVIVLAVAAWGHVATGGPVPIVSTDL
ncbi:YoaK family protein [Humibacter sp. RRB41]|uniref:YoaK family protein n=1 Tax=Humibacter sp. RRB41 TaxID=2919946 RepID=UPI001FAA6B6B|nr:YoaK family protein [Humibacter sp. RRB41]